MIRLLAKVQFLVPHEHLLPDLFSLDHRKLILSSDASDIGLGPRHLGGAAIVVFARTLTTRKVLSSLVYAERDICFNSSK